MKRVFVISVEIPEELEYQVDLNVLMDVTSEMVRAATSRGWRVPGTIHAPNHANQYERIRNAC